MKHILAGLLVVAAAVVPWRAANAGDVADDLRSCVTAATGADDRRTLVQWMFSAIALHPDLQGMAEVSDAHRQAANRAMGALMERLLTVDCADHARRAVREEVDERAFGEAFASVGQLAGEGLFEDPLVAAEAAGLVRHVDMNRLVELFLP